MFVCMNGHVQRSLGHFEWPHSDTSFFKRAGGVKDGLPEGLCAGARIASHRCLPQRAGRRLGVSLPFALGPFPAAYPRMTDRD